MIGVLEVEPHGAASEGPPHQLVGRDTVASLEVSAQRPVPDRAGDASNRLEHRIRRHRLAVLVSE